MTHWSISSLDAAEAVKNEILRVYENADVICLPLADGGEGTVESLCKNRIKVSVKGPLGEQIVSEYGITDDGNTAVIEMASAAGLPLVPENKRDPLYPTTYGVGELMDTWLNSYADKAQEIFPNADKNYPGTGAAGGLGFAFMTFLGGILRPGVDIVTEHICLEERVRDTDIVVTGEGRIVGQTVMGKAPIGVARIAKKYGKTVIAFSGSVTDEAVKINTHGIDAFFRYPENPRL